jgi:hypothetical protein
MGDNTSVTTAADNLPAPIAEGPGALLSAIVQLAKDPHVDVAKLGALLEMQARMEGRQAEQQFNEALHRLTLEMPRIKKNGSIEYKGKEAFKFATWEDIDTAIRPLLQREGFSLSFDTAPRQGDGGGIIVTGTLSHIAGHKRTASIPVPLDTSGGKNNIQGYGSALAYGRRYTSTALLNIVTEGADDDGVRGGVRFITPDQIEELGALMKRAGRQEGPFLDRLFGGTVHSIEEIEAGAFVVVKNALNMVLAQQAKKESQS